MNTPHETQLNLVSEGTRIEGQITFDQVSRVHGILVGQVHANIGSTLILSETAIIEGSVDADTLMIDGYIKGNVVAKTRVHISKTGRVIGNIFTPSLVIEFGAYFEGKCNIPETTE